MSKSSNTIRVACRGCEAKLRLPADQPGARFKCPKCGGIVVLPGSASAAKRPTVPSSSEPVASSSASIFRQGSDEMSVCCPQCGATRSVKRAKQGQRHTCDECLEEFELQESDPLEFEDRSATSARAAPPSNVDVNDSGPDLFGGSNPEPDLSGLEPGNYFPPLDTRDEEWDESPADRPSPTDEPFPIGTPAKPSQPEVFEFTVECPICHTRQDTTTEQIGQRLKCPDCYTQFAIRQPHPNRLRRRESARRSPSNGDSGELRIQDEPFPFADSNWATQNSTPLSQPPPVPKTEFPQNAFRDLAEKTMAKARAELTEREKSTPKLPGSPFFSRLFEFTRDLNMWSYCGGLGFGFAMFVITLQNSIRLYDSGNAMGQFVCMVWLVVAALIGLAVLIQGSGVMSTMLRETAHGRDQVEHWPGLNFSDNCWDMLHISGALFWSILPGFFLGQILGMAASSTMLMLATIGVSVLLLFPVLLLSSLENNTPFWPVSPSVIGSLKATSAQLVLFYVLSFVLALVGVVSLAIQIQFGWVLAVLMSTVAVFLGLTYFRLLGRMAWVSAESKAGRK